MICKNCGFKNAAGDQFCGSCGKFLEWTGEADSPAEGASAQPPAGAEGYVQGEPVDATAETQVGLPPVGEHPPTTPPSSPPPKPITQPVAGQSQANPAAGVICWNCGRHNPATRSFCQQCGERLSRGSALGAAGATGAAGAGGAARAGGAGVPRGPRGTQTAGAEGGGGRSRVLAVGLGVIAALLLAGGAAALFLGSGPAASPTPTTAALPSGSPLPGESASPSLSPNVSPSATVTASPSASPTASPTAPPTASPTAPPTASPTPTPPPTPKPTPPPPTPSPTPVHCDDSTSPNRFRTFSAEDPSHPINPGRAWCVHQLIFIAQSGEGLLKLYLTNPIFLEQGYSSERIGWHEANMPADFAEGPEYMPPLDVIQPYRLLPPGTLIELEITCSPATPDCSGIVQTGYERISAP